MLKLYGPARSRASRVLWMLEECGIPYEHDDLSRHGSREAMAAALRAVYPLGKVPVVEVDGKLLSESMAINLWLAREHGRDLWPADPFVQAQAMQWSFFAVTELDPPLVQLMLERSFRKDAERDAQNEQKNAERIQRPLRYLDDVLRDRQWLLENRFTVADLNAASVFTMAGPAKLDLNEYPNIRDWTARCFDRPAHQRAAGNRPA